MDLMTVLEGYGWKAEIRVLYWAQESGGPCEITMVRGKQRVPLKDAKWMVKSEFGRQVLYGPPPSEFSHRAMEGG